MTSPIGRGSATVTAGAAEESSQSASVRFAFRLFRELARSHDSSNLFFSPACVMLCVAMVHELASGKTRTEMTRALEMAGLDRAKIEAEIALLRAAFRERAEVEVALANAIWISSNACIASEVGKRIRDLYDSELRVIDFSAPDSTATINA